MKLDTMTLAQLRTAEHEYAKVLCGLMDQFASLFGRAGHVVELDCRSLEYAYFPFDTNASRLVLCNSGVKHALGDTEYNKRREECAAGGSDFAAARPGHQIPCAMPRCPPLRRPRPSWAR
ncbi:MAG: hypothetical protein WKG07_44670 [Hymenobacter sp.]